MVIGRVKWFGGVNNQTEKINHFGFISLLDDNDEQSAIYLSRKNIDRNIQDVLKDRNGEGVYLEFDIDTNDKGSQAINVNLITLVGIVEWFEDGRGYINCEGRSDVKIKSEQEFFEGEVLYFALRYNSQSHKDEAIFIQKADQFTNNLDIINKCINSGNVNIFMNFIPQYAEVIKSFSLEEASSSVNQKLSILKNNDLQKNFLGKLSYKYPQLFIDNSELRKSLSTNDRLKLVSNYLESGANEHRQYFIDNILRGLASASVGEAQKSNYWEKITYLQQFLQYRGYLWDLAPLKYQQQAIKNHYHSFFKLVADFHNSDYPYSNYIAENYKSLYQLNDQENKLIKRWDSSIINNSFNEAKMIAARGAEKLVINFYRSLGDQVEDISLHQITQESKSWILGDVMLNSQDLLDVKNARTEVNSNVYSEFCVPNFKNNRGTDVKIVAVLSQYLQKNYMVGEENPNFPVENPKILGTVTQEEIKYLESLFSGTILKINISRDFYKNNNYLPPWVFDYDQRFYVRQNEIINEFKKLANSELPPWQDLSLFLTEVDFSQVLSLFIAAKVPLPQIWTDKLPKWQVNFINDLINIPRPQITLPYLFLSILKHFLSMLSYEGNDYNPMKYGRILGAKLQDKNVKKQYHDVPKKIYKYPLKIYDPLNIINDFCESLQSLWQNREKFNLNQFKIFKFNGQGLLKGKRFEEDKLITLLAYCGGKIEKKGKCGFTPLVIGQHQNCPECGFLICPNNDCGFCSRDCSLYMQRKNREKNYDITFLLNSY